MPVTNPGQAKQAAARCGLSVDEFHRRRAAGMARCYVCTEWKPVTDFAADSSRQTGRASICKPCNSRRSTASRYGLTVTELDALPGATGICPICTRADRPMHVDHNHDTGTVRGFLCVRCNVGLGQFGDSRDMLAKAIAYLEGHDA
jgi:hypothetical protein